MRAGLTYLLSLATGAAVLGLVCVVEVYRTRRTGAAVRGVHGRRGTKGADRGTLPRRRSVPGCRVIETPYGAGATTPATSRLASGTCADGGRNGGEGARSESSSPEKV